MCSLQHCMDYDITYAIYMDTLLVLSITFSSEYSKNSWVVSYNVTIWTNRRQSMLEKTTGGSFIPWSSGLVLLLLWPRFNPWAERALRSHRTKTKKQIKPERKSRGEGSICWWPYAISRNLHSLTVLLESPVWKNLWVQKWEGKY